ncbi:hypothetical protein HDU93_000243 [Gonapodya sp. JEL0774]|nr:hypothetical protein HDU93_000243 [Gonapodya sp. JEL0774]
MSTVPNLALAVICVLIFPASWIYIHFLMGHPERCFADECIEDNPVYYAPVRQSLAIFYSFIGATVLAILGFRRVPGFERLFVKRPFGTSTVTAGELIWFVFALLLVLVGFDGLFSDAAFAYYQQSYAKAKVPISWGTLLIYAFMHSSGGISAVIYGLVMLPVSKHSPLGSALGLDYTVTLRIHRWLGWSSIWVFIYHTVVCCYAVTLAPESFAQRMRNLYDREWGEKNYICTLLYTIDVFIRIYQNLTNHVITSVTHEDSHLAVLSVSLSKPVHVVPGQFMRVTIPSISWWESHAWSVCGATEKSVEFLVGPVRGGYGFEKWTDALLATDKLGTPMRISMQGPFGTPTSFIKPSTLPSHDAYIFVVGGTGIAPALFAIRGILASSSADVKSALQSDSSVGLTQKRRPIYLFWSVRSDSAHQLSPILPWLVPESPVQVHIYDTSRAGSDMPTVPSQYGSPLAPLVSRHRPGVRNLLHKVIERLSGESPRLALFVCGPESMTLDVLGDVKAVEESERVRIDVDLESFTFGVPAASPNPPAGSSSSDQPRLSVPGIPHVVSASVTERTTEQLMGHSFEPFSLSKNGHVDAGFPAAKHRSQFDPRTLAFKARKTAIMETSGTGMNPANVNSVRMQKPSSNHPSDSASVAGDVDMSAIQQENMDKIRHMSEDEIKGELDELAGAIDPSLLTFLGQRARKKYGDGGSATVAKGREEMESAELTTMDEGQNPLPPDHPRHIPLEPLAPSSLPPISPLHSLEPSRLPSPPISPTAFLPPTPNPPPTTNPTLSQDDLRRFFPNEPAVNEKLQWTISDTEVSSHTNSTSDPILGTRFHLSGAPIPPSASLTLPSHLALHHHADNPEAAGYTVTELVGLARSRYPAQKAVGGRAVAGLVRWCAGWVVNSERERKTAPPKPQDDYISVETSLAILNYALKALSVPALSVHLASDTNASVSAVGIDMVAAVMEAGALMPQGIKEQQVDVSKELEEAIESDLWSGAVGVVELADPTYRTALVQTLRASSTPLPASQSRPPPTLVSDPLALLLTPSQPSLLSVLASHIASPVPSVSPASLLPLVIKLASRAPAEALKAGMAKAMVGSVLGDNWPCQQEEKSKAVADALRCVLFMVLGSNSEPLGVSTDVHTDNAMVALLESGLPTALVRYMATPLAAENGVVASIALLHARLFAILVARAVFIHRSTNTPRGVVAVKPLRDFVVAEGVVLRNSLAAEGVQGVRALAAWTAVMREVLNWGGKVDKWSADKDDKNKNEDAPGVVALLCDETRPFLGVIAATLERNLDGLSEEDGQPKLHHKVHLCTTMMAFLASYFDASVETVKTVKDRVRNVLDKWCSGVTERDGWSALNPTNCEYESPTPVWGFWSSLLELAETLAFKALPRAFLADMVKEETKRQIIARRGLDMELVTIWDILRSRSGRTFLAKWLAHPRLSSDGDSASSSAVGYAVVWLSVPGEEAFARMAGKCMVRSVVKDMIRKLPMLEGFTMSEEIVEDVYWGSEGFVSGWEVALETESRCWSSWLPMRWDWPIRPLSYMGRPGTTTELERVVAVLATALVLQELSCFDVFEDMLAPWVDGGKGGAIVVGLLRAFLIQIPMLVTTKDGTEDSTESAFRDPAVSALLGVFISHIFPTTVVPYDEALFSEVLSVYMREAYGDRIFCLYVLRTLTCLHAGWWQHFWSVVLDQGMSKWRYAFHKVKVDDADFVNFKDMLLGGSTQFASTGETSVDDVVRTVRGALGVLEEWELENRVGIKWGQWEGLYAIAVDVVSRHRTGESDRDLEDLTASRIAVVGSGPAGVSAAYYTRRYLPNATIVVYERSEVIGGGLPLQELQWGFIPRLQFGMVWSTAQTANLTGADFQTIHLQPGFWDFEKNAFDTESISGIRGWLPAVSEFFKFGIAPPVQITRLEGDTLSRFSRMSNNRRGFTDVAELLAFGMIDEEVAMYAESALEGSGVIPRYQTARLWPVLKRYFPSTERMSGLAAAFWFGTTRTGELARKPKNGLQGFYKSLLDFSNSEIRLSTPVKSVEPVSAGSAVKLTHGDTAAIFDAVIIATGIPREANSVLAGADVELLPEGPTVTVHLTYVDGEINPTIFGRSSAEELPNPIYTLGDGVFHTMGRPDPVSRPTLFRITSPAPLTSAVLSELFTRIANVERHDIDTPTFQPTDVYPPFQITNRIFYGSALAGVVPTSEGAFVGGRNAAMLLCKFLPCFRPKGRRAEVIMAPLPADDHSNEPQFREEL